MNKTQSNHLIHQYIGILVVEDLLYPHRRHLLVIELHPLLSSPAEGSVVPILEGTKVQYDSIEHVLHGGLTYGDSGRGGEVHYSVDLLVYSFK
jgi:hypothetical protein